MTDHITDHALVRWLERARGIDMEGLREALALQVEIHIRAGVRSACIDGNWYIFRDGRLVTVLETKPTHISHGLNDNGNANGTHVRGGPMPWKARKRKRPHK